MSMKHVCFIDMCCTQLPEIAVSYVVVGFFRCHEIQDACVISQKTEKTRVK